MDRMEFLGPGRTARPEQGAGTALRSPDETTGVPAAMEERAASALVRTEVAGCVAATAAAALRATEVPAGTGVTESAVVAAPAALEALV